jgi:hypothetical protein
MKNIINGETGWMTRSSNMNIFIKIFIRKMKYTMWYYHLRQNEIYGMIFILHKIEFMLWFLFYAKWNVCYDIYLKQNEMLL